MSTSPLRLIRRSVNAPRSVIAGLASVALLAPASAEAAGTPPAGTEPVRFATFNVSLNRDAKGQLLSDLQSGDDQATIIAEIIQRNAPDILLLNEFDFDDGDALDVFADEYLAVGRGGAEPVEYPYRFVAPSNTGIDSGFDLDNDGSTGGPNDAQGFGFFPGQFGMAVLSTFPIDEDSIRTFQEFLWADMPGARLPDDPATAAADDWYTSAELDVVRLSSKSHWDVPILVGDETVHFLVSHPTPPVFDGPEDRNGRRNADEIRFWADYVDPAGASANGYIYDDDGGVGGLGAGSSFVIAGDMNADPNDGDSLDAAALQLLDSPAVNTTVTPSSPGGSEQAAAQGGANASHSGDPAHDTADFADTEPGNLRVDYVLPSADLSIVDAGVFWPQSTDPDFALVGTFPFPSSDHRLVYVDIDVLGGPDPEIPEAPFVVLFAVSGTAIGAAFLALDRRRRSPSPSTS